MRWLRPLLQCLPRNDQQAIKRIQRVYRAVQTIASTLPAPAYQSLYVQQNDPSPVEPDAILDDTGQVIYRRNQQ